MCQPLVNSINRAWRIFATGLSFAVFGIGGFLLGTVMCLLMRLMIPDQDAYAQAVRRRVSSSFRLFAAFMGWVGVLRWQAQGLEHYQPGRPFLVVANHPTLIDIIFLLALFPGADCVVKAGVLRNPFWGLLVKAAGYVSNEDPGVLIDEAARRLQLGRSVVLFPEGTRSVPGQPLLFGSLAGAIAVRADCWCLPVAITCDPPTLYKGLVWHAVPARRVDIRLHICPPLRVWGVASDGVERRRAARLVSENLRAIIAAHL